MKSQNIILAYITGYTVCTISKHCKCNAYTKMDQNPPTSLPCLRNSYQTLKTDSLNKHIRYALNRNINCKKGELCAKVHTLEISLFTHVNKCCSAVLVHMCEQGSFQVVHCHHFCCAWQKFLSPLLKFHSV